MNTNPLDARIGTVWGRQRQILDRALAEGRGSLTADEKAEVERLDVELDAAIEQRDRVKADPVGEVLRLLDLSNGSHGATKRVQADLDAARAYLLDTYAGSDDATIRGVLSALSDAPPDAQRGLLGELQRHLERRNAIAESNSFSEKITMRTHARDVTPYGSAHGELRDLIQQVRHQGYGAVEIEWRALQSEGGSAVPTSFYTTLTETEIDETPMLDPTIITLHNVNSGEQWTLPRIEADAAYGGTVVAEAGSLSLLDATVSAVSARPFKAGYIQKWSMELATDNVLGLEAALARSAGKALGTDINTWLTTGTGTVEPFGWATEASVAGTATLGTAGGNQATDTFYGYQDLVDLYMSVKPSARRRGVWQMSTTAVAKALKMTDANGYPYVQQDVTANGIGTLLGRPIIENSALDAVASASVSVGFGAFDAYHVVRLPVRIEASKDFAFQTDEMALRVIERVDGRLVGAQVKTLVSDDT